MKCIHCRGKMKRGTTPLHVDRKGCHLTLDAVPAWVCEQYLGSGLAILYSSPPTTMVFNSSDSPADAGPVSYAFD